MYIRWIHLLFWFELEKPFEREKPGWAKQVLFDRISQLRQTHGAHGGGGDILMPEKIDLFWHFYNRILKGEWWFP